MTLSRTPYPLGKAVGKAHSDGEKLLGGDVNDG